MKDGTNWRSMLYFIPLFLFCLLGFAASGEAASQTLYSQDFNTVNADGVTPPTGWSVVNTAGKWQFNDPNGRTNKTGGTNKFAIADSDYYCSVSSMDASLVSPAQDFTGAGNVFLRFRTDFNWLSTSSAEKADVDVSTDGGNTWSNVWSKSSSWRGPVTETVDISSQAANKANVKVRFHYYNASCEWWWQVDDISFFTELPANDATAPVTTTNPLPGTYTSATVSLTCTDNAGGAGCDKTYSCLGAACTPALNAAMTVTLADGANTLKIYSIDKLGNVEPTQTLSYTIDTRGPTVSISTYANAASSTATANISVNAVVRAGFNEAVTGIDGTSFTLTEAGGPVAGAVTYTAATKTATFTPAAPLTPNTAYTATITTAVKDAMGNVLNRTTALPAGANKTFLFTTEATDTTPPTTTANRATGTYGPTTTITLTCSDASSACGASYYCWGAPGVNCTPNEADPLNLYGAPLSVKTGRLGFYSEDAAGNQPATPTYIEYTLDNTGPSLSAQSPSAGAVNVPVNTTISATFNEAVTGISTASFKINNGAVAGTVAYDAASKKATFTPGSALVNNTLYTVTISSAVRDSYSNTLTPVTWSFTTVNRDTAAPTTTADPASGRFSALPAVTLTCADNTNNGVDASGCKSISYCDGIGCTPSTPYTAPVTPYSWTDGTYTLGFQSTDNNGNVEAVVYRTYTLDSTRPTIRSVTPVAGAVIDAPTTTVTAEFSEDMDAATINDATFMLLDFVTNKALPATVSYAAKVATLTLKPGVSLADGGKYIAVVTAVAADTAGNTLAAPKSWTFTNDNSAPVLNLSMLASGSRTNSVLNVAGVVVDSSPVEVMIQKNLDVAVTAPVATDGTFSASVSLDPGDNVIKVTAKDSLGRIANNSLGNPEPEVRTIRFDNAAPILAITDPADNSVTNTDSYTVFGGMNESCDLEVIVNNVDKTAENSNYVETSSSNFWFTISKLASGLNTIQVKCTDSYGNSSVIKRSITYDGNAPSLQITDPPQDITTSVSPYIIKGSAFDLESGITITSASIGGTPASISTSGGSFTVQGTFSASGTYVVAITARDQAGNETTIRRNITYEKSSDAFVYAESVGGRKDGIVRVPLFLYNSTGANISAMTIDLTYDTSQLEAVKTKDQAGNDIPQIDKGAAVTTAVKDVDARFVGSNGLRFTILSQSNNNIIGDGLLGEIVFKILNPSDPNVVVPKITTISNKVSAASSTGEMVYLSAFPGSVTVITMTGDCNADNTVTINEVQNAINMILDLTADSSCVDKDNDGVDATDVSNVYNNYFK